MASASGNDEKSTSWRKKSGRDYEDNEIPREPPFTAILKNLRYSLLEEEVHKFFGSLEVQELKLYRDELTNQMKGYGTVTFETREGLINALMKDKQKLGGRRVRITLTNKERRERRGKAEPGVERKRRGKTPECEGVENWRAEMKPRVVEDPQKKE